MARFEEMLLSIELVFETKALTLWGLQKALNSHRDLSLTRNESSHVLMQMSSAVGLLSSKVVLLTCSNALKVEA